MKKPSTDGFNWRRHHFDDSGFIKTVSVGLIGAIIFTLAIASIVGHPTSNAVQWCDPRTTNCYDQLIIPLKRSQP